MLFRYGAETFLLQDLQEIFKMAELSTAGITGDLRETLMLSGTSEEHYFCPILLSHPTLAQGNLKIKV